MKANIKQQITIEDVKSKLSGYEQSYTEAANKNDYASWDEFCQGLLNAANECNGTMDDITFQAEDAFNQLGIEI